MKKRLADFTAAAVLAAALAGCAAMGDAVASVGVATGTLSTQQGESIRQTAQAVEKSFQDITPEQEYYIGRTVGAVIVSQYRPYPEPRVNEYLNVLGRTLSLFSDRPETFGGYHFLALDTGEINAFAAPGGDIYVSRGLLRCAASEDEVAAILAHEIGHVVGKHGLQAIKKSRLTTALTSAALTAGSLAAPEETAKLSQAFGDSIKDITSTLINNGYSRELEAQADQLAVGILGRAGYDPAALVRVLETMSGRVTSGGPGFGKIHPDPRDRIQAVQPELPSARPAPAPPERQRRYEAALSAT